MDLAVSQQQKEVTLKTFEWLGTDMAKLQPVLASTCSSFPEQGSRTPPQGPTDGAYLLDTPSPFSLPVNHSSHFSFLPLKVICLLDFHFLRVFHVYFIHCCYHLSHAVIFPAKPSVFKRANFCNLSLLMMTLAWVETSNKIDKSHLSDPWLV